MSSIWTQCNGAAHIRMLQGKAFRMVESQEQVATRTFVDTLEEQSMLEELLESAKPKLVSEHSAYHYLLKTPFRYPPLKWGSRFGRRFERSLFYAGKSVEAVLAEVAFYRFVFWRSMQGQRPKSAILSEHSLFSIGYKTPRGICLQELPFKTYQDALTHPSEYTQCQQLGSAMREAQVAAFEYVSARTSQSGICVGVFTPEVFTRKKPQDLEKWFCDINAHAVSFKSAHQRAVYHFAYEQFLVDGCFPLPA